MSALLYIKQLNWKVSGKTILNNVDLNVSTGEIVGIIGPNGAGKTSLLRCILNQQKDFTGTIHFKGKNINSYSAKKLARHFAVVAQKANPIFALSVFDVVSMGLLPHKTMFSLNNSQDLHQMTLALEKVGLANELHSQYNHLSGGEQQRVLIARALVQKAVILILDEPTNHLDVYYQHQILTLVKNLNITVIMTVHDLNLAAQYCQRLVLLNKGEIVADDIADKVLNPIILTEVFQLPCQREQDPVTNVARVYFHLADQITTSDNEQLSTNNEQQRNPTNNNKDQTQAMSHE
ncbi:MAG: ABC transporter ATP-binding protein [Alteromonadaceae bacterium]|nr:ABC transporter ATP-binding protein [Alteromonadaceae bacterium]